MITEVAITLSIKVLEYGSSMHKYVDSKQGLFQKERGHIGIDLFYVVASPIP